MNTRRKQRNSGCIFQPKLKHPRSDPTVEYAPTELDTTEDRRKFLSTIFCLLSPHIWFKITDDDHENNSICNNLGIQSSLLYPLLHDVGVISNKNNKVTFNVKYCNDVLKVAHNQLHPDHQISFTFKTNHDNNRQREYYLCIGKPQYASLAKQLNDPSFHQPAAASTRSKAKKLDPSFEYSSTVKSTSREKSTIIEQLQQIYQTNINNDIETTNDETNNINFDIINNNGADTSCPSAYRPTAHHLDSPAPVPRSAIPTATVTPSPAQQAIYNKRNVIQFALQLNFDIRPRLKRDSEEDEEIQIMHKRKATDIYLVMDNAGGHGNDSTIQEYKDYLRQKHNIIIIHQCPRSPCTNTLDLGVWTTLQHQVEKEHRDKRTEVNALAASVKTIWNESEIDTQLKKVFKKARDILTIIVKNNGSIKHCETQYRGMKDTELLLTEEDTAKLETWRPVARDITLADVIVGNDGGDESDDDL